MFSFDKSCCPFHSEKTPSFSVKREDNMFKCFGCGESGDSVDFVAKIKNIDKVDAAKLLAGLYHIDIDIEQPKARNTARTSAKVDSEQVVGLDKQAHKTAVTEYIKSCIKDSDKTDYFARRGLSADTVKKYSLGYDIARKSVLIPYSSKLTYYQTRSVEGKSFYKPKTEDAGAEPLFNGDILWKSKEPIFVVESPICALSIMQCGVSAIALCGVGGANKLIKEVKGKKIAATLILSLDNDEPGQKASQDLGSELFELGVKFDVANISDSCKDPNELLMQEPSRLAENILIAKKKAKKKYATEKTSISAYDLQKMKLDEPNWLIPNILPPGLSIICASSKVGKSWMMMQLAIALCDGKEFLGFPTKRSECAYLALEDGQNRLQERLNKMLKNNDAPKNLYLVIKADPLGDGLEQQLDDELAEHPKVKLIIIDTLQKVRGNSKKNEMAYAMDYRELGAIKEFADKRKIGIFLVHHLRKMSDDDDVFNMISGSNGIMGVCDTIFIIKKKRKEENATLVMTGRDIRQQDLVVHFDDVNFCWEVVGTVEEEEQKQIKNKYDNSPVVITIKALMAKQPYGWSGTATEFVKAIYDATGKPYGGSSSSIGKEIADIETKLYYDGIEHKSKRSGSARQHTFCKRHEYLPFRQASMIED
ncbi:MAG: AAA family ATPase [Clostridia bacterium]